MKHNNSKNPNWQEANQSSIYSYNLTSEPRVTQPCLSYLNLRLSNFKSGGLTTWTRCLLCEGYLLYTVIVSYEGFTSQNKLRCK